jgi:hypothetical protein
MMFIMVLLTNGYGHIFGYVFGHGFVLGDESVIELVGVGTRWKAALKRRTPRRWRDCECAFEISAIIWSAALLRRFLWASPANSSNNK